MVRTVYKLGSLERGFDPRGRIVMSIDLPKEMPLDERINSVGRVEEVLKGIPCVRNVSITAFSVDEDVRSDSMNFSDGTSLPVLSLPASSGLLQAAGLRLDGGKWLPEQLGIGPATAVLNRSLARRMFGGEDPIGRTVNLYKVPTQILGVVEDTRPDPRQPAPLIYYVPYWQDPNPGHSWDVLIDFGHKPMASEMQQVLLGIREASPKIGARRAATLEARWEEKYAKEKGSLSMLQMVAMSALVLATLGLFSTMAYSTAQRTREFAIRLTLGATPSSLIHLVLIRGLFLAGVGTIMGLGISWIMATLISEFLFQTQTIEPISYITSSLILLGTSAIACCIPALRASRVAPMDAMKTS
jgi:hypothetical protein